MRAGLVQGRARLWILALAAAVLCMLAAAQFAVAQAPGPATISAVVAGDGSLTVVWDPPAGTSGSDVTAYDVRYIETSADETIDSNWELVSSAWASGPRHYMIDGLTNGTSYDVQVRAVTTTAGEWSATVAQTPGDAGGAVGSAVALPLDVPVAGVIDSATDVDVFEVTVPERLEVLIYTTGDLEAAGSLLDSGGAEIYSADFAYLLTTVNNFLLWDTLSSGTYYVSVSAGDGSTGSYTLHTESTVNTTGFDDAAPIGVDSTANAIIGGGSHATDYYRLDLDAATDVLIYTTADIEDTVGALYDSDEQQLAANDDGYLHDSHSFVIRQRLDAGTYYVTVRHPHRYQLGPYTLYVQAIEEPGSSLSSAASLHVGRMAGGNIDPASDVDYFRIDVDEARRVEIRAASATAGINGTLLDSGGNTLADAVRATSVGVDDITTLSMTRTLAVGTYYLRVDTGGSSSPDDPAATGAYVVRATEDIDFRELIERCRSDSSVVQDLLYGCQWNLSNTGQSGATAGEDINVEEAWETTLGSGVVVAVVDSRVDGTHEDLADNFDAANSHDYLVALGLTARPGSHGTAVAGVVAGRNNGIGVRGVAPEATIRSYNVLQDSRDVNAADAMARHAEDTAVNTNSWGPINDGFPLRAPRIWELALEHGLTEGDSGRGTFYTWSAGNAAASGPDFDNVNLDEYTNFYGVTAVCSVNYHGERSHYSEEGAALWVCAPSSDGSQPGPLSTALGNGYSSFGGTSAASPQAAGVAALVRAVNPSLSWRDVKLILAASARKNDPDHSGWQTGAAMYGSDSESYEFNHSYGFGVLDAGAAVELAQGWTNVPALRSHTVTSTDTPVTVGPQASDTYAESTATMRQEFEFIEFVEVNVVIDTPSVRHLEMDLVSPQGAVSELLVSSTKFSRKYSSPLRGPYRLGSARHLGENPDGEWTLRLRDRINGGRASTLESWSLTVYGHGLLPGPPDITSVDGATDPVTVSWDAPEHSGASAITGYDLRYIRSDASDKADFNWTVASDVWSSGTLEHTVTGLSAGVDYDFQVRAVSAEGAGGWSFTVTGKIDSTAYAPRFGPAETGIRNVAENTEAGVAIGDPVAATDDDGDTLTYTATGVDASEFTLDAATGQLSTKAELDHESRSTYTFGLVATDGDGHHDTIDVTVNVTDVNEPPDLGAKRVIGTPSQPQRLSGTDENDTDTPWLFVGTDPEDDELRWTLSGADAAHFALNDTDLEPDLLARYGPYLQLEFASPPDFENPGDDGGDNTYDVTVEATDGTNTTSQPYRIAVLNVDEAGAVSLSSTQPEVGTAVTAELSDPDGGVSALSWSWQRSPDRTMWSTISGAGSAGYTPVTADLDQYLRVVATYSDGHGSGKSARADTTDAVSPEPTPNANPQFPSTESGRRTVDENTPAGTSIGSPVAATDPDGDTLTYALGGPDASSFDIVASTGQILTSAALDHEAKDTYSVTVSVHDSKDAHGNPDSTVDDTVALTVAVNDVHEEDTSVSVVWSATLTVGVDGSQPPGSGYSRWSRLGALSDWRLTLGGTSVRVMLIVQFADGLFVATDSATGTDFTLTLGDAEFTASESLVPNTAGSGRYWWPTDADLWTDQEEVDVTITAGTATLGERAAAPPIAFFSQIPSHHDGTTPFTLRLNFDRELPVTAAALKEHALHTVGGTVTAVSAQSDGSTWLITVQPDGASDVTISLPAEAACDQPGAVCTADGQRLHNLPQATVPGPTTD